MDRLDQSCRMFIVLLALCAMDACNERKLIGINSTTARQACASKNCGEDCSACSSNSCTAPDVVGYCGADGTCAEAAPSCSPDASAGGEAGSAGSQGISTNASVGCGRAEAPTGQFTGQTITVAGQARTYALSVPTDYTGSTPLALVLAWHGANINGNLARKLFNLESNSNGAAIFAYPDGLETTGALTWDLASGSNDVQLASDLVNHISSNYCVDLRRIFSTGHSTGAMMANSLGCNSNLLRAVALVSGMLGQVGRAACTGQVATWITHGENDPTVNFSSGEAIRDFWSAQNGCSTQTKAWAPEPACIEYQDCKPDLPVVWCVHDQGHGWPRLSGEDCTGVCFDGGPAIWTFFSNFH